MVGKLLLNRKAAKILWAADLSTKKKLTIYAETNNPFAHFRKL